MEFPASYKDFSLPKFINNTFVYFGSVKELFFITLYYYSGVEAFLNPEICWPTQLKTQNYFPSSLAVLTRELLHVVKYCELVDPPETCAVCLSDFSDSEEIRRLANCQHIFHRKCVDRCMDHDQMTCPLCRTPFLSYDMQEAFNERLWTATGISDYYY